MHSTTRDVYVAIHQTLVEANDPNPRSTAGDPMTTLLTPRFERLVKTLLGFKV
jgi:hypothetical protein